MRENKFEEALEMYKKNRKIGSMLRNALRIHQDQFRCAKLSVGGQIFI